MYPVPGFAITTESINSPPVFVESKISGEEPRPNSITVPAAIVAVIGLLNETVVRFPTTVTPFTVVSAAIPATVCGIV